MPQIKAPKGVADILPAQVRDWQRMERIIRRTLEAAGFAEIRLPIFEVTELFARSIGAETDIVSKEMYTFQDRGGRTFSLRPEGTAGAVRAYLEHRLYHGASDCRLYYLGPMFRAERPQAGRFRQFNQVGVEVFGLSEPGVDAEVIAVLMEMFTRLGLAGLRLDLNSLGCPECRPGYLRQLQCFLEAKRLLLCTDCQRRAEINPQRVFDCKQPGCQGILEDAPKSPDSLCAACRDHFRRVCDCLEQLGYAYQLNSRLVRGLDYYNRTAFEIVSLKLGAQNAIAGGGRYDGLVELLGGPSTPAFGYAIGLERLNMLLQLPSEPVQPWIYLVLLGDEAKRQGLLLLQELRKAGLSAQMGHQNKSLKKQLQHANKLEAPWVLILGEDELAAGNVILRDMRQGTQEELLQEQLIGKLKGIWTTKS